MLTQLVADVAGPNGLVNGLVQFLDNGQLLGTANVVNGVGTLLTNLLSSGTNLLTAVFTGVDGLTNLGGSTSPPVTIVINPPGGGGGGGGGSGGSQPGGIGGTGSSGFVVPPPLDAAVAAADQSTFDIEGFVLALQPFLSNPLALSAVVSGLSSALSDSSDPNVGLLLFQEFRLFSDLAAYINNPSAYQPNSLQTVALASAITRREPLPPARQTDVP